MASATPNLRLAEQHFRQALQRRSDLTDARVRLARVLFVRERHDEARTELHRALAATTDPVLLYYSHLFLADAEQALGNDGAAREAYHRAAALYPRAQSPYLGLSLLARRRGDRAAAVETLQGVFSLPVGERERADPWWTYDYCGGRYSDALLAEVRTSFREERP